MGKEITPKQFRTLMRKYLVVKRYDLEGNLVTALLQRGVVVPSGSTDTLRIHYDKEDWGHKVKL